jgi:hypothetical protein
MPRSIPIFTSALLFLALGSISAQDRNAARIVASSRSPVALLSGYKVQVIPGIDSSGGKIWKERGLTIEMELCCGFGNAAESVDKSQILWREEQTFNGQRVVCVYTRSKDLIVSFPKLVTNFRAKIRNPNDLTEMLLMVLTFEPQQGYATDPGAIVPPPPKP